MLWHRDHDQAGQRSPDAWSGHGGSKLRPRCDQAPSDGQGPMSDLLRGSGPLSRSNGYTKGLREHSRDAQYKTTDLAVGVRIEAGTDASLHRVGQRLRRAGQRPLGGPSGAGLNRGRWLPGQQGDRSRSHIEPSAFSPACRRTGVATTVEGARPCRRTRFLLGRLAPPFKPAARAGRSYS
jgi:hypothetical protein